MLLKLATRFQRTTVLALIALCAAATAASAQDANPAVYRRSSLSTILIESKSFPYKDTVIEAFIQAPFPDKYNNHDLGVRMMKLEDYLSDAEIIELLESDTILMTTEDSLKLVELRARVAETDSIAAAGGGDVAEADTAEDTEEVEAQNLDGGKGGLNPVNLVYGKERKEQPGMISKWLAEQGLAREAVALWFNRQPDGSFNMDTIAARGQYDASQMQVNIAGGAARGTAMLADAGLELIANTFLVVTDLRYQPNEPIATVIHAVAYEMAGQLPGLAATAAQTAADVAYNRLKDGYSAWAMSHLYQLEWNDSVEAVFYNDLWVSPGNIDSARVAAWDTTDLFRFKYIGTEYAQSLVTQKLLTNRTDEELIKEATVRNVDNVYNKLQKAYEPFMPKVPILSVDPVTASIGMKEGLSGNEKFAVLEQNLNLETGETFYKQVATVKVAKGRVWDNRYNLGDGGPDDDGTDSNGRLVTEFKGGGKNVYPGMLLKQLK